MSFITSQTTTRLSRRAAIQWLFLFGSLVLIALQASAQPHPGGKPSANQDIAAPFTGKVVETMDAANYTYVLLDIGKQKVWVAATRFAVKKGDSVTVADAMPMRNFHSETFKRDFDVVYFTGHAEVNGKAPAPKVPAGELPPNHPAIPGQTVKTAPDFSSIKKAPDGKTIAEIYSGKTQLKGKQVKVRGKVVKYNPEVMGKNWLHIQDGTGETDSKDLTITTSSKAKVGDTVLVTGKVALNRDFGSGYHYDLMLEDAKVKVE